MLFVSEFKKAVEIAKNEIKRIVTQAEIDTIVAGQSEYVTTSPVYSTRIITLAGQDKLYETLMRMRVRAESQNTIDTDAWIVKPDMPRVLTMSNWQFDSVEVENIQEGINWLKNNRLNAVSWMAYLYQLSTDEVNSPNSFAFRVSSYRALDLSSFKYAIQHDRSDLDLVNSTDDSQVMRSLEMMMNVKISKESYVKAIDMYKHAISDLEAIANNKKVSGIGQMFAKRPGQLDASSRIEIRDEAIAVFDKIKNGLSSRTWGFEIEVPDAKGVDAPTGIEKGDDGSLRSENTSDCECDCSDCTYHECNCDMCDNHNDDPSHCSDEYCTGEVDSAEFRSTGGIQRVLHVGMIELCDKLVAEDAEINSSAGTHIHVYAQDLTTNQVGQVLATYHWLYNSIFWPIAGRHNNSYAKPLHISDIANALRKKNPVLRAEKPLVVNVTNLLNGRGTIEFRHQNCNLDSKLISVWAWLVRGLVETSKRGATFAHYKECKSVADMLAVYAKFNFTPESENPGLVIAGSRSDESRTPKVTHKVLTRS